MNSLLMAVATATTVAQEKQLLLIQSPLTKNPSTVQKPFVRESSVTIRLVRTPLLRIATMDSVRSIFPLSRDYTLSLIKSESFSLVAAGITLGSVTIAVLSIP